MESINDLKLQIDSIINDINDTFEPFKPTKSSQNDNNKIKKYCDFLREDVNIRAESIISEIYKQRDNLLNQIDIYEKETVDSFEMNHFINLNEQFMNLKVEWNNWNCKNPCTQFDSPIQSLPPPHPIKLKEDLIKEMSQSLDEWKLRFEENKVQLNSTIFNRKQLKYDIHNGDDTVEVSNLLGQLVYTKMKTTNNYDEKDYMCKSVDLQTKCYADPFFNFQQSLLNNNNTNGDLKYFRLLFIEYFYNGNILVLFEHEKHALYPNMTILSNDTTRLIASRSEFNHIDVTVALNGSKVFICSFNEIVQRNQLRILDQNLEEEDKIFISKDYLNERTECVHLIVDDQFIWIIGNSINKKNILIFSSKVTVFFLYLHLNYFCLIDFSFFSS
jgi:hypothetical protein